MKTIPAREIDHHGISVVDEALEEGPVHITRDGQPCYVIMDERRYRDLIEIEHEVYIESVKAGLKDLEAGRVRYVTADELIAEYGLDD